MSAVLVQPLYELKYPHSTFPFEDEKEEEEVVDFVDFLMLLELLLLLVRLLRVVTARELISLNNSVYNAVSVVPISID